MTAGSPTNDGLDTDCPYEFGGCGVFIDVITSGKKKTQPFWNAACWAESKKKRTAGQKDGPAGKCISFASKNGVSLDYFGYQFV